MSTVNTTNVKNAASSKNNIVLGTDGDTTVYSQNTGQLAGRRNIIINGDFSINQRYGDTAEPMSTSNAYYSDRWALRGTDSSGGSGSVYVERGSQSGGSYMYCLNCTDMTSWQYIYQTVEAGNIQGFSGQQMTVSVSALQSTGGTDTAFAPKVQMSLFNSAGEASTIVNDVVMTAVPGDPWRFSATFTLPTQIIGTAVNARGLQLVFKTPDPAGTMVYKFWNAQLEPGPVATPFENISMQAQLADCQRYFQFIDFNAQNGGTFNVDASWYLYNVNFPTQMRTPPTLAYDTAYGSVSGNAAFVNSDGVAGTGAAMDNATSTQATMRGASAQQTASLTGRFWYNAEL